MSKIVLPPLPRESHGFYVMMSSDTLRARDLEVARVVLEAAAKECDKRNSILSLLDERGVSNTDAFWFIDGAKSASKRNAQHIRALEFGHE